MNVKTKVPLIQRIMAKVRKTRGCWFWTGSVNNKGYGELHLNGKTQLVHRVMCALSRGLTLKPGMSRCVLHRCDTQRCVRPSHLFLGTPQQNTDDMMKKGRWKLPRHIAAARARKEKASCRPEK